MVRAKISSKGQIVLPKAVREALGVGSGDEVRFALGNGEAVIRPVRSVPLEQLVGRLGAGHPFAGRKRERAAMEREVAREALGEAR